MRTVTIYCKQRSVARRLCPWAARIARVEGGYKCFESLEDFRTWSRQV